MEWCIDCHRDPEKHLRPEVRGHQHDLEPGDPVDGKPAMWMRRTSRTSGRHARRQDEPAHRASRGRPARRNSGLMLKKQYNVRDAVTHDELLDVPPVRSKL